MGQVLNADQRRHLDGAVQRARTAAESAAADALRALAVPEPSRPSYLGNDENALRLALRDKARQLGDDTTAKDLDLTNLTRDIAYEQWHRLLFARFLEVNGLLRHPDFQDTPLSLEDCADLADDLGEPDGWSVAARFACEILPGVFRLDDPAVRITFAVEHRLELERILLNIPAEVFVAEDSLGWVYQFWQTSEKKRVNEVAEKIGRVDLSPVTQLFTENYMVRFLLENSLGAWWAARHPDSLLVKEWNYLRWMDGGTPAAGTFPEWPATAAELTVMDPCCGSGHFLVAAYRMLWRMRAEEERLGAREAQDLVLAENLFGLELDARCTQIALFALALESWREGGYRTLPLMNVACSGTPTKSVLSDWLPLANGDQRLEDALERLHHLFSNADTFGSLITPAGGEGQATFGTVDWEEFAPLMARATTMERKRSAHSNLDVFGAAVFATAKAAELLSRRYTLVATNVPYLSRTGMDSLLQTFVDENYPDAKSDLATVFIDRIDQLLVEGGTQAVVSPQNWLFLTSYSAFRAKWLRTKRFNYVARLGRGAFTSISGEVVNVVLAIASKKDPSGGDLVGLNCVGVSSPESKALLLRDGPQLTVKLSSQYENPDHRITLTDIDSPSLLSAFADGLAGIQTGDYPRFGRCFWERPMPDPAWEFQQSTVPVTTDFGGRQHVLFWESGLGALLEEPGAYIRGGMAWGKRGVAVSQMGNLPVTLYTGELFDNNTAVILPKRDTDLPAIWAFCSSDEFSNAVREIDDNMKVTNATLVKVPFDIDHWRHVAATKFPGGLPHGYSSDPTQWLFEGGVVGAVEPLQVAMARLLGYSWPGQVADALDEFADADGIAALQSLPGESDLATRLREVLSAAHGSEWSSALERSLVTEAGGKNGRLEDWLRDTFFAQHVKVFDNRPFLWHIWDGRKDGFSAVVNYHRLDHRTLEKLTFTSLGAWIERQKHEVAASRAGADSRLAAAEELQAKLKLILEGEAPYDVYVRWKALHEQPIGWNPDLNDGVRLNIRPFVTAGILRSKVNVHWKKDRGTNADGAERLNDLHPTLHERREGRLAAGVKT